MRSSLSLQQSRAKSCMETELYYIKKILKKNQVQKQTVVIWHGIEQELCLLEYITGSYKNFEVKPASTHAS